MEIRNWGRKEMEEQLAKLQRLIQVEKDPIRKDYLITVQEYVRGLIINLYDNIPKAKDPTANKIYSLASAHTCVGKYYSLVDTYFDDLSDINDKMDEIIDLTSDSCGESTKDDLLRGTATTPAIAVKHTFEFYETLDPDLYGVLNQVSSNCYVNFTTDNCEAIDANSDGTCSFIDGVDANFIAIKDFNNARSYQDAVHEFGHAIKNLICPVSAYTEEVDFFAEVPSIFPELVALNENIPGYPKIAMDLLLFESLLSYHNDAYYLNNHRYILEHLKQSNYRVSKEFLAKLLEDEGINRNDFYQSLDKSIISDGTYVISFITSLELLHIYKRDKKLALQMFKEILKLAPNLHSLADVESIVPLNVHAKEESERICDDFLLSLRRK